MNRARSSALSLALLALLPLTACETVQPTPVDQLDLWKDSAAGVSNGTLAEVSTAFWEASLRWDPFQATALGDSRFDDRIPYTSRAARAERVEEIDEMLLQLGAVDPERLGAEDRLTFQLLRESLEQRREQEELGLEDWNVDPLEGPHVDVLKLAEIQPHETARERERLVARWRQLSSYVRQASINLEYGLAEGKVASRLMLAWRT